MGLIFTDTICKLSPKFLTNVSSHDMDKVLETIRKETGVTVKQNSVLGDWDSVKKAHSYFEKVFQKEKNFKLNDNYVTDSISSRSSAIEDVLADSAVCETVQNNHDQNSGSTTDSKCKEKNDSLQVAPYSKHQNTGHDAITDNISVKEHSKFNDNVLKTTVNCNNVDQSEGEHKDYLKSDVDKQNLGENYKEKTSANQDFLHEIKQETETDETASAGLVKNTKNYNKAFEKNSVHENDRELKCDIMIKTETIPNDEETLDVQSSSSTEEILEDLTVTKGLQRKQFSCQWCSKKFKNNKYLQRHIRFIHKGQDYCCKVCNKKYKQNSLRLYKKHIQTCKENSSECKEFQCEKCAYIGKSKAKFNEHVARMHQNKLACGICFKQFGLQKELVRHQHTVHSKQCYCCNICSKVYKINSLRTYKKHLLTHGENHAIFPDLSIGIVKENENSDSKTKLKPVNIDEVSQSPQIQKLDTFSSCMDEDTDIDEEYLENINEKPVHNNGFQNISDSKLKINIPEQKHTAMNSEPPKSGFYCLFCDKSYKTSREYKKHMSSHQEDYVELKYKCETCHKSFSTENVLKAHVEFNHNSKKKSFICQVCNKEFSKRYFYLLHIEAHQGIKRYICDICGKAFRHQKTFKDHKYVHEEVKQFSCDICAKKFTQRTGLNVHLKIHSEFRDYICPTCGKGFTQRSALVRHERVHTGDKPFKCALCSRSFNDYSIIRRHMIMLHKRDKDPRTWQADVIRSLKSSQKD